MEQVTDVIFRHVVKKAGAPDLFYTEFSNATGWVHAGDKGIGGRLVKTADEHPIVAQIWGGEPGDMEQFAKYCAKLGYDGIDINMGCPAKSAVKSGGSALIRQPELAAQAIAAAKTAGLPVSVKTRLGYSRVDEWQQWLAHLLQQDIVTLTIHLRTKKEMSKVPAHWELIPKIKALRDEIAPHTLLVINGDIQNRQEGERLVKEYGVDGVMIGRGIFSDPFCFAPMRPGERGIHPLQDSNSRGVQPKGPSDETTGSAAVSMARERWLETGESRKREQRDGEATDEHAHRQKLINLLHYHLNLYDQYSELTHRPFETLKRFFKIYIRDFDGASDLRDKLMHTKSTDEVRALLHTL